MFSIDRQIAFEEDLQSHNTGRAKVARPNPRLATTAAPPSVLSLPFDLAE